MWIIDLICLVINGRKVDRVCRVNRGWMGGGWTGDGGEDGGQGREGRMVDRGGRGKG